MNDARTLALESLRAFTSTWRALVVDSDRAADVRDLPGISVRWADSPFMFWRAIALTDGGSEPEVLRARLVEAASIMRSKPAPGLLWIFSDVLCAETRTALPALAADTGFELAFSAVGQAGDILPLPAPDPRGLTFERVTTEDHLRAYGEVNARAYGMTVEDAQAGLVGSTLWRTGIHAYLGLENGVPVTAAATMETDGRLFVLLVATVPEAQRKGYGEAVTRYALHKGGRATGLARATLHATEAGAPVYPRIGFQPNTPLPIYALPS